MLHAQQQKEQQQQQQQRTSPQPCAGAVPGTACPAVSVVGDTPEAEPGEAGPEARALAEALAQRQLEVMGQAAKHQQVVMAMCGGASTSSEG